MREELLGRKNIFRLETQHGGKVGEGKDDNDKM